MNEHDDNAAASGGPSLSDIQSTRRRMLEAARRPLWALVALAVGYSLPFLAADSSTWLLTVAVALGFLAIPSALSLMTRSRSGVSADVLSVTRRATRLQFGWAIAMIVLLTATVILVRFAEWTFLGYAVGALVLVSTPFAMRAIESVALQGLGRETR